MTTTIGPQVNLPKLSQLGQSGLQRSLEKNGQSPPVGLIVFPLSGGQFAVDRFLDYSFKSSILVPVDSFSFKFAAPDGPPLTDIMNEGDVVTLTANDVPLATGIIDTTETETDAASGGETCQIMGRDLLGQLEDQSAVSLTSSQIYASNVAVQAGVKLLLENTKITKVELRDAPSAKYLLSTEPNESKLAGLQRFLEPLNCLAWMSPSGTLIVGRPNQLQSSKGKLILSREKRFSNVLVGKVTRSSTQIANIMVPIWTGQESVVARVAPEQALYNKAPGPSRLQKLGYLVPKAVVVSPPNATDPQGLSGINALQAGGSNILQAYAKRELARENIGEIQFVCAVQGHYNEAGEPYMPDTVYHITYDRGNLDEDMYLYAVEYSLSSEGQKTTLSFCRFGCIVSDIRAP